MTLQYHQYERFMSCGLFPPLYNSMKRKEMGSNAWQYSECKCVKKRGRKRHPQILCNVPGGTQCCRPHTRWLHRKGRSFMEVMDGWGHARTSLHKASILEVLSSQQRRWGGRWNSLLPLFFPLTEKIKRFFFCMTFCFLECFLEKSMWK